MTNTQIAISITDIEQCGWESLIADCESRQCGYYSRRFFTSASEANEHNDAKAAAVFTLLGAATSLYLRPDNKGEPFAVFSDGRSAAISDFSDHELELFAQLVSVVGDSEVEARLADVLWLRRRDYRMAMSACNAYRESCEVLMLEGAWVPALNRVKRAVQLARQLGRSGQTYPEMIAYVENVLERVDDLWPSRFVGELMGILLEDRKGDPLRYATLASTHAEKAEAEGNWPVARQMWEINAKWMARAKDKAGEHEALLRAAKTNESAADGITGLEHPKHMIVAMHLKDAIEAYRRIEGTSERVRDLHTRLLRHQMLSTEEKGTSAVKPKMDDIVESAISRVTGRSPESALRQLVFIAQPPARADVEQMTRQLASDAPFYSVLSQQILDHEGKTVASRPPLSLGDEETRNTAINDEIYRQASIFREVVARFVIDPARKQIAEEHQLRVEDLAQILGNSLFVPPGRVVIFARGLHAGFGGDFLVASHLLVFQIENSLRFLLGTRGVTTSSLSSEGIQEEYGLDRLLSMPETESILGEDLVFDLRGLLIERHGSNIRNRLAHGLLRSELFGAPELVYLWWLVLGLSIGPVLGPSDSEDFSSGESPQTPRQPDDIQPVE